MGTVWEEEGLGRLTGQMPTRPVQTDRSVITVRPGIALSLLWNYLLINYYFNKQLVLTLGDSTRLVATRHSDRQTMVRELSRLWEPTFFLIYITTYISVNVLLFCTIVIKALYWRWKYNLYILYIRNGDWI